jgi:hypothetical protein
MASYSGEVARAMADCERASKMVADYATPTWAGAPVDYEKLFGGFSSAVDAVRKAMEHHEGLSKLMADCAAPSWVTAAQNLEKFGGFTSAVDAARKAMEEYSSMDAGTFAEDGLDGSAPEPAAVTPRLVAPHQGAKGDLVEAHLADSEETVPDAGITEDWFYTLMFFIPKSIREPWFGDIREDRAVMTLEGKSRMRIELATVVQLMVLILSWLKETLLEVFAPGKKQS